VWVIIIPQSPMIRKNANIQGRSSARTVQETAIRRQKDKETVPAKEEETKRKVPLKKKSYQVATPILPDSADSDSMSRSLPVLVLGRFSLRCRIGHPKDDFRAAASDGGCPIALVLQWQCAGPVHGARQTRRTHRTDCTRPILSRTTNERREVRQFEFTAQQQASSLCKFFEHAPA
jgi:hypothetical protein